MPHAWKEHEVDSRSSPATLNGESVLTASANGQVLTVVSVGEVAGKTVVDTGLTTRVVGTHIVIDHDTNNKPLVDALVQAGVPRSQIVLTYAGETMIGAA